MMCGKSIILESDLYKNRSNRKILSNNISDFIYSSNKFGQ